MSTVWTSAITNAPEPLRKGSSGQSAEACLETPMSTGDPKYRCRSTATTRPYTLQYWFTDAQMDELHTLYYTTTKRGATFIEMTDPERGDTADFRIRGYSWDNHGPDMWLVTIAWKRKP